MIATASPYIYTLSLHDALPISDGAALADPGQVPVPGPGRHPDGAQAGDHGISSGWLAAGTSGTGGEPDRKSTRLNSSHVSISYAVFCLKKKKDERYIVRNSPIR